MAGSSGDVADLPFASVHGAQQVTVLVVGIFVWALGAVATTLVCYYGSEKTFALWKSILVGMTWPILWPFVLAFPWLMAIRCAVLGKSPERGE